MVNIQICYVCLNMVVFHPKLTIYFWVIMWIEENNHWRQFVYYWPIRSSIQKIFSFFVAIMNVPALIVYMASMMNVCIITLNDSFIIDCHLIISIYIGKRRYNIKLWKTFTDCFNCLPIAAIIDEKIFCCHGGRCKESIFFFLNENKF